MLIALSMYYEKRFGLTSLECRTFIIAQSPKITQGPILQGWGRKVTAGK